MKIWNNFVCCAESVAGKPLKGADQPKEKHPEPSQPEEPPREDEVPPQSKDNGQDKEMPQDEEVPQAKDNDQDEKVSQAKDDSQDEEGPKEPHHILDDFITRQEQDQLYREKGGPGRGRGRGKGKGRGRGRSQGEKKDPLARKLSTMMVKMMVLQRHGSVPRPL